MSKVILVTGATGKQGGAVIRSLLDSNADLEILAVTRYAESPSAQKLAMLSPKIKIVQGNLDRPSEIFDEAAKVSNSSVWGVFSVQTVGVTRKDAEEIQGKGLIDAALERDVKFFVYSSVDRGGEASSKNPTNVPHFATKHRIEEHLFEATKNSNMQWTVLRPVAFFDNIVPDFFGKIFCTSYKMVLEDRPLQLIATSDIGYFAAQAFLKPDEYQGQCISLAGDELKFRDFERIFEEKTGEPLPLMNTILCRLLHWISAELYTMYRWFHDRGYQADIPALRAKHPELMDFSAWLEKESVWKK